MFQRTLALGSLLVAQILFASSCADGEGVEETSNELTRGQRGDRLDRLNDLFMKDKTLFNIVGREWEVPICVWAKKPANAECIHVSDGFRFGFAPPSPCWIDEMTGRPRTRNYRMQAGESRSLDWGGGVALYSVSDAWCSTDDAPGNHPWDYVQVHSAVGTGDTVVAHATGFITHVEPARVRGAVSFTENSRGSSNGATPADAPLKAVLQAQNPDGSWKDVRAVSNAYGGTLELEAVFEPGSAVRLEVRIQRHPSIYRNIGLYYVRLFGAECFPLENRPGVCVE
jgi:hypothetical protein